MKSNNVFIFVSNNTSLKSALKQYSILISEKDLKPFIISEYYNHEINVKNYIYMKNISSLKKINSNNFAVINFSTFKRYLSNKLLKCLITKKKLKSYNSYSKNLITNYNPRLLIIYSDREFGLNLGLINQFKLMNRKILLVKSAYSSVFSSVVYRAKKKSKLFNPPMRSRKDLNYEANFDLLFYNNCVWKNIKRLEFHPINPWIVGSANIDKYITFNDIEYDFYKADFGVENVSILEHLDFSNEECDKNAALEIRAKQNILKIIFAIPQLPEHGLSSWDDHLKNLDSFFKSFELDKFEFYLSFHPKSNPKDYKYLIQKYKLKMLTRPLSCYIKFSDVFISGYSTTLFFARNLGIPYFIYDFNNLQSFDIEDPFMNNVLIVKNENDCQKLSNILNTKNDLNQYNTNLNSFGIKLPGFRDNYIKIVRKLVKYKND